MAKDRTAGSAHSSEGGSRAAKKRRKQKDKSPAVNPAPPTGPKSDNKHNSDVPQSNLFKKNGAATSRPHQGVSSDAAAKGSTPLGNQVVGSKRKLTAAISTISASSSNQTERQLLRATSAAAAAGTAAGGSSSADGGGGSSSSGGGGRVRAGRGDRSANTPPPPTTIDASAADDRSRLLLELDAQGVLSDVDVESGLKARQLLQWMIAPLPVEEFYRSYW